jgi:hypothetical protein
MPKVILLTVLIALSCTQSVFAGKSWTAASADSTTYRLYLDENWPELIRTTKEVLAQSIDFKFLRQRLGFAYYQQRDFYASMKQYEQAYRMDPSDQVSLTYLYFAGLESGNVDYARYFAGQFSEANKLNYKQKGLRLVSGADVEYNLQVNAEPYRGNADYQRLGLSTDLGYTGHLYQTVSRFGQGVTSADSYNEYRSNLTQYEYYLLFSKQITAWFGVDVGYHRLATAFKTDYYDLALREVTETWDTLNYRGNLFFAGLRWKWNRIHLSLQSSYLNLEYNHLLQSGIQLGYALPGSRNLFLNNALWLMHDDNDSWWVSKHSLGMMLGRKCWLEGYRTFGKLNNFADLNGLYVYNSFDPILNRTGMGLFWYATTHLTFFGNFTYETKQNTYLLRTYHQESLTAGILWKI